MKKIILLLIPLFMICGCDNKSEYQKIEIADAKEKIKQGAYLIDVRSKQEYNTSHIEGAVNIPVEEIENPSKKIITKEDTIIVYCRSGKRSSIASETLKKLGYNVLDLGAFDSINLDKE